MKEKFDLNDIQIIPEIISEISSRSEVDPYINGKLPLITSPMYDVINTDNVDIFNKNKINTILPRNLNNYENKKFDFYAFGLNDEISVADNTGILIDIANGHMKSLINRIKEIKKEFPNNPLMVGNIARPETFIELSLAGADFVRLSIGSGTVCTTSANVGVNYPLGSLISETRKLKVANGLKAKIVVDGGMKSFTDIIKSLALGADYCMMGGIFAKAEESAAQKYLKRKGEEGYDKIEERRILYNYEPGLYSSYQGMSTKESQKLMGNEVLKTGEGIKVYFKIEYNLSGWAENFEHYLRSAMSYTNSRNLEEFKESEYVFITEQAFKRFNK